MEVLILFFIFTLGILFGSFFNVLIDRLPNEENPFKGRSHCDYCKKPLKAIDLIPVLSFILLGGKCRHCKKKLSWQYPIVELLTGILFIFTAWYTFTPLAQGNIQYPISNIQLINFISLLIIFSSFLVIFVADLKYQIIPDEMLITLFIGTLSYHVSQQNSLVQFAIVGFFTGLFFLLIYKLSFFFLKKHGMGFGDVKLAFLLGFFVGFPYIITALYVAFLTGAFVSSILILTHHKHWGQQIAFGPFLLLGAVVSFFYGAEILQWYLSVLGA